MEDGGSATPGGERLAGARPSSCLRLFEEKAQRERNQSPNNKTLQLVVWRVGSMHVKARTRSRQRRANRFLLRYNRFYRSPGILLLPVTGKPSPAAGVAHPATLNPDRGRSRTLDPMSRHPYIARASPLPVAIRPNVGGPWCNCSRLNANWRRRLGNQNLPHNRSGCDRTSSSLARDFSRCRGRDRRFRDTAS